MAASPARAHPLNDPPLPHPLPGHPCTQALVPEQQARDFTLAGSRQGPLQHLVTALFNLGIVHQSGKNDQPVDYSKALKLVSAVGCPPDPSCVPIDPSCVWRGR